MESTRRTTSSILVIDVSGTISCFAPPSAPEGQQQPDIPEDLSGAPKVQPHDARAGSTKTKMMALRGHMTFKGVLICLVVAAAAVGGNIYRLHASHKV